MMRGGRGRKRDYEEEDSYHRDNRHGYQPKRARGSFSSRESYNSSSRGSYVSKSRGSYISSPRGSSSRGSYNPRGSYSSSSRGSYSSSFRGSYNSGSRGSGLRGSYCQGSRGSYNSSSRASYSPRGFQTSRDSQRQNHSDRRHRTDNDRHDNRYDNKGHRPSRTKFRSPSPENYTGKRRFGEHQGYFRDSRSPSFKSSLREGPPHRTFSRSSFQHRESYRGRARHIRESFNPRFQRERSSSRPFSRDSSSDYVKNRAWVKPSYEKRYRRYSGSPSFNKTYHGSDISNLNHPDEYQPMLDEKYLDDNEEEEVDNNGFQDLDTLTEVKPDEESETRKADLAAIILRLLMDEGGHMKVHDLEMELITSKNIQFPTSEDFDKFLSEYKDLFKIHAIEVGDLSELGEKSVTGHSKITICRTHSKISGSCKGDCNALHVCKYRVLSECARYGCVFGHDVRRDHHNKKVLKDHMLHRLSFPQLQQMFRNLYNRQGINIPLICSFYNSETGCRSEYKLNNWKPCPFLHICKKFIDGSCNELSNCRLSHNIYDKTAFKILERYGLNPDDYSGGKREILRFLKNKCPTSTANAESLEEHSVHEEDYSDEEDYNSWDEYGDVNRCSDKELQEGEGYPDEENFQEGEEGGQQGKESDMKDPENLDNPDTKHGNEETHQNERKQQQLHDTDQNLKIESEKGLEKGNNNDSDENAKMEQNIEGKDSEFTESQEKCPGQMQLEGGQNIDNYGIVNVDNDVGQSEESEGKSELLTNQQREKQGEANEGNHRIVNDGDGGKSELGENDQEKKQEGSNGLSTKKSPRLATRLKLVKGKRRMVKQRTRVKSDVNVKQQSENVDVKCPAKWDFSLLSQEEWKELGNAEARELEERYQQYVETKMHSFTLGDTEYKIDFSTLEAITDVADQEGIKLRRSITQT